MHNNTIAIVIHIGDKIHHQDQEIILVNFNTINATVNKPLNPIPLDELELLELLYELIYLPLFPLYYNCLVVGSLVCKFPHNRPFL